MSADNEYHVRVFKDPTDDERATPLLRALHADLCRLGQEHTDRLSVCQRAEAIVKRWQWDGEPMGLGAIRKP